MTQQSTMIEWVNPASLKEHPLNHTIYGDEPMDDLIASIQDLGILQPLHVKRDNVVISGHRRFKAAKAIGLPNVPVIHVSYADELEERQALLEFNRYRHKTGSQLYAEGLEHENVEAELAKRRQVANAPTPGQQGFQKSVVTEICREPSPDRHHNESSYRVAASLGIGSGKQWDKLKLIGEQAKAGNAKAAELLPQINNGMTITTAMKQLKYDTNDQKRKDQLDVNIALTKETPTILESLAGRTFATVVIDPPWDWGDEGDNSQMGRGRPVYQTQTIDQLMELPIPEIVKRDAHLYLWITNRSLPKGFALMDKWGFRYITCITWVKPSFGMGNYFRGSTEHVLFGVKGSLPLLRKDVGTSFTANRGDQHSSKPDAFYGIVEQCSPGPWLDMYARKERSGWVTWGAET